jgi:hypothetical protein
MSEGNHSVPRTCFAYTLLLPCHLPALTLNPYANAHRPPPNTNTPRPTPTPTAHGAPTRTGKGGRLFRRGKAEHRFAAIADQKRWISAPGQDQPYLGGSSFRSQAEKDSGLAGTFKKADGPASRFRLDMESRAMRDAALAPSPAHLNLSKGLELPTHNASLLQEVEEREKRERERLRRERARRRMKGAAKVVVATVKIAKLAGLVKMMKPTGTGAAGAEEGEEGGAATGAGNFGRAGGGAKAGRLWAMPAAAGASASDGQPRLPPMSASAPAVRESQRAPAPLPAVPAVDVQVNVTVLADVWLGASTNGSKPVPD